MNCLTVTATLTSTAYLSLTNTNAYFLESRDFITGRVLLGAAAWACINQGQDANSDDFQSRFVAGGVSWGDLHPITEATPADTVPLMAPRTAKTCKLHGLAHGLTDTLLNSSDNNICSFNHCGVGLERLSGSFFQSIDGKWHRANPRHQNRTHLSIGFETGTARSGYLFSRDVIEEGQAFRGQIFCENDALGKKLVEQLQALSLSVGGGRSRGYGQIQMSVTPCEMPKLPRETIAAQSRQIQSLLNESSADTNYFTLTATSPWFLHQPDGAHARTLTSTALAQAMGLDATQITIRKGDVRSEYRTGWDGKAGLPTESRHLVSAGSTFLCSITGVDEDQFYRSLAHIHSKGIGAEQVQGFGRVIINHPMHFIQEMNNGN